MRPRVEVLTPRGAGGVAVLLLRGSDRLVALSDWLRTKRGRSLGHATSKGPRLAVLCPGGEVLDEVLVVDRPGVDCLELHLHGSEAVLHALAVHADIKDAVSQPAEELLRMSRSDAQLRLALEQCREHEGGFSVRLASLAGLESSVRRDALLAVERRTEIARALVEPARVVLSGSQNAGKSTLMNRLLFRERVLTGDLPGLTRDPVREVTTLCGYPYEIVDTAGEGEVDHSVDRHALELARREREDGFCLLVADGSRDLSSADLALHKSSVLVVRTKSDLSAARWSHDMGDYVSVSCVDAAAAGGVRDVIGAALRELRALPEAGPVGGLCALSEEQRKELSVELASLP